MSAGCCVIGKNETETLRKELGWLAIWAESFVRDLLTVEEALVPHTGCFGNGVHTNWGDCNDISKEELCAKIDALHAALGGLQKGLRRVDDENKPILPRLIKEISDLKDQAEGKKAIPVQAWYEREAFQKVLGDKQDEYILVRIEGDEKFFRLQNEGEMYTHICDAIDKKMGCLKETDKRTIALVFCDGETIEHLRFVHLNLIQKFQRKYPGLRIFHHADAIVEAELPDVPVEKEEETNPIEIAAYPAK